MIRNLQSLAYVLAGAVVSLVVASGQHDILAVALLALLVPWDHVMRMAGEWMGEVLGYWEEQRQRGKLEALIGGRG